ncbi:MAG TPA: hypothetical protein VNT27_01470 [Propionibacteriaceae bacterium]|nr:hypothetical protein [Propionibacteriaceae bacterium]
MRTQFFGERSDAPIVDDALRDGTPAGERCYMCNGEIQQGQQGFIRAAVHADESLTFAPIHRGCDLATTIGHTFGVCHCYGFDDIYEAGEELVRRIDGLKQGQKV